MAELEEEILRKAELKPYLWWRYIDDIFFLWEHGEEKLQYFIGNINKMYPTIKSTADWSKTSINVLDVTVPIAEGIIKKKKNFMAPFLWMGFNCLKARATSRRQFTFYH